MNRLHVRARWRKKDAGSRCLGVTPQCLRSHACLQDQEQPPRTAGVHLAGLASSTSRSSLARRMQYTPAGPLPLRRDHLCIDRTPRRRHSRNLSTAYCLVLLTLSFAPVYIIAKMGLFKSSITGTKQMLTASTAPSPVHFFSHGSTMMLGEESSSADYWKKCGDEALANGIKGVVMMVGFLQMRSAIFCLS